MLHSSVPKPAAGIPANPKPTGHLLVVTSIGTSRGLAEAVAAAETAASAGVARAAIAFAPQPLVLLLALLPRGLQQPLFFLPANVRPETTPPFHNISPVSLPSFLVASSGVLGRFEGKTVLQRVHM